MLSANLIYNGATVTSLELKPRLTLIRKHVRSSELAVRTIYFCRFESQYSHTNRLQKTKTVKHEYFDGELSRFCKDLMEVVQHQAYVSSHNKRELLVV